MNTRINWYRGHFWHNFGVITALGIAKTKNESATRLVIGHVFLALVVITISYFTGKLIAGWIK